MVWEEVEIAEKERRRELVLSGANISSRINKDGCLDKEIFNLQLLNFLEISHTCLDALTGEISKLNSLTNLVLRNNKIQTIDSSIGSLPKLKMLDLSVNCLRSIPDEIQNLEELQSLNISSNQLSEFPDISSLHKLHVFDISHNQLECLPPGITNESLAVLAQIKADSNAILSLPNEIYNLVSLRSLDVSDNKITDLPPELSKCLKLKELKFDGNKLKDRRLMKMGQQCQTKSILDYLSKMVTKAKQKQKADDASEIKAAKEVSKKERKKNKKLEEKEVEQLNFDIMKVLHFDSTNGAVINVTENIEHVRPYIVCSVVKNVDFKTIPTMFKRFINLQTKLHDTICQKRNAATIATHDLVNTKLPLTYDAMPPQNINIVPLFAKKSISADDLMEKLIHEADEQRKEKKRNQVSGIHKYLDLLKGKQLYPCLVDKDGLVISFPPITNCDATKISDNTQSMLIEVTSSTSFEICKQVMDQFLAEMLKLGMGGNLPGDAGDEAAGAATARNQLEVEQVKIIDTKGHMKVVYPSRVDLTSEGYKVLRDYE